MKARTVLLASCLAPTLAAAAPAFAAETCAGASGDGAVELKVHVAALRDARGEVAVTVYPDDPRRFLAPRGKLLRQRVRTSAPVTTSCFLVRPGHYAIAVYHDENGDRDFARSLIGLPAEGYGFSNDAPSRTGLPAFSAVRFRVPPQGRTIRVTMRYP